MKSWFYWLVYVLGWPPLAVASHFRMRGRSHVPRSGGFFMAINHTHHFDVVMVMAASPRAVRWLSITQVSQGKWRWFMERIRTIPLRRGAADVRAARDLIHAVHAGDVAAIFPEARIRRGDDRLTHGGTIDDSLCRLARTAQVPIVPCVVAGCEHFRSWRDWLPLARTRWAVSFGAPIAPDEATPEGLAAAMRALYRAAAVHAYPESR
jgi:1-acyl-sn-glycerol-3-phosphate acyltransferase